MTVPAVGFSGPTWIQIPGNGAATSYSFPFLITAATDLAVGFIVGGVYTLQLASSYTVSGVGNAGGGQVSFTAAPPFGTLVDLRSQIPETQPTNFANLGGYLPESTTNALDRAVRNVTDLYRLSYLFGIHGPDTENTTWPALPGPAGRAGGALVFDTNGLPSIGVLLSTAFTQSLFNTFQGTSPPYAKIPAESAAGVVPSNLSIPTEPIWNIKRYGAQPGPSIATNLAALNTAILVASKSTTQTGVVIEIPADCPYGFQVYRPSTYPQFIGNVPILIIDYSQGSSYSGFPSAYDGTQARYFSYTPQTTALGHHDGNGFKWFGNWAPYFWIDNTSQTPNPSTQGTDNRRANLFFGNDGDSTWGLGQGSISGSGMYEAQLTNFIIQRTAGVNIGQSGGLGGGSSQPITFSAALSLGALSGTLVSPWLAPTNVYPVTFSSGEVRSVLLVSAATTATWTVGLSSAEPALAAVAGTPISSLIIDFLTGNWMVGTNSNDATQANYHFKTTTDNNPYFPGYIFESQSDPCWMVLRDPTPANDVAIKNNAGNLVLNILGQGDAVNIAKTDRRAQIFNGVTEGQSGTSPATITGGTIATAGLGVSRVNPATNITGVILAAGTYPGQMVTVINEANFTIAFAVAGTSFVADGATSSIPVLSARRFVWDSATSLWYRCA